MGYTADMPSPLARESETFRRELPGLLANPETAGRYVLIHGDAVAGVYDSFDEALDAGYDRFELKPFFVKQILLNERPQYLSRNLIPCH